MAQRPVGDAYLRLGLEQGASMDQVRSAYKQLALRTHPDKNQGNAEATAKFQEISEAYTVLEKHHAEPLSYCACGRIHDDDDDDDDCFDIDVDEEDGCYYFFDPDYESEEDRLRFFKRLYEQIFRGRAGRAFARNQDPYCRQPRGAPETQEEYDARLKRTREEREQAETRRAKLTADRKAFEARTREQERKEAGERQRAKVASRKAEAENQRKKAAEAAQLQKQRVQSLRSATFAAARAGDGAKVKKGVWEDSVDAAGGEIKTGGESYVVVQPEDPLETLSHIAARNGDASLVEWLDAHSADPEERNSCGLSAFHVALQHGHVQILRYFFESYDPKQEDHNAIYGLSPPGSLLSIALDSAEPEVVWMILDRGLATTQDVGNAWTELTSLEGERRLLQKLGHNDKYTEIRNLLMSYGGFTPPPTPKVPAQESSPLTHEAQPLSGSSGARHDFRPKGRGTHRSTYHAAQARHPLNETPLPTQHGTTDPTWRLPERGERAKARGHGRGRGRGHGRARGRGPASQARNSDPPHVA